MITHTADFTKAVEDLEATLDKELREKVATNDTYSTEYLFCRTNRKHFLPQYKKSDWSFFRSIQQNKELKLIEDRTDRAIMRKQIDIEGDTQFLHNPKPYVFCAFHFGPFFQIGPILDDAGFTLSVLTEQGIEAQQLHYSVNQQTLPVHHSNQFNVMLNLLFQLKKGKSTLAFLDGNLGVATDKKSSVPVNFLGHTFYCKTGIPYLSYVSKTPLIPVIAYRKPSNQRIVLHFDSPIYPEQSGSRQQYVLETIQQGYDFFSRFLMKYPEQWTVWHSLHAYMDLEQFKKPVATTHLNKPEVLSFNATRFSVYRQHASQFLLDVETYEAFAISASLEKVLNVLQHPLPAQTVKRYIPEQLMLDLMNRQILQ